MVSMAGKDGQMHRLEVKASSLFDAAYQAIQGWDRLWWYDASAVVEVRTGKRSWKIRIARVRSWRNGKN
jgi:hypothetical protein